MSGRAAVPSTQRIMVAYDGSENAKRAVTAATSLAKAEPAEVVIFFVQLKIPPVGPREQSEMATRGYEAVIEKQAKAMVDAVAAEVSAKGVKARGEVVLGVGSVIEALVEAAEREKPDLVVMGTRGLGGFRGLLLGSVSLGVLSHAPCSVMIVR